MTQITDFGPDWSDPVTLTADEIWQCKAGRAALKLNAEPDGPDDGLVLNAPLALDLREGEVVRYRRVGRAPAVLQREARG